MKMIEKEESEIVISSAYLSYNELDPPATKELEDLLAECIVKRSQLVIGCFPPWIKVEKSELEMNQYSIWYVQQISHSKCRH